MSGTLEIVSPQVPEDRRVLADYQKVPTSLCMWSGPTPPGGVDAEIVLPPNDIRNADLKGKLVLGGRISKPDLAKAGALGMIHESTTNPTLLDERDWVNSFGDNGWAFNKNDTPLVCFSITPRSEQYLHELLKQGPVKVRANVDSRYYDGQYPYVSGAILGTDGPGAEEVFSLGHLFEEGAGDNATGVASIIEATATLNRLIKEGKLPRPKRTIRILAMGERYGTLAYLVCQPGPDQANHCRHVHRLARRMAVPGRNAIQLGHESAIGYFVCGCICFAPCRGILPDGGPPLYMERVQQGRVQRRHRR